MQSSLDAMSLQDLSFMFVNKVIELSALLEQKGPNDHAVRDLQIEIEKIQEAINARKPGI